MKSTAQPSGSIRSRRLYDGLLIGIALLVAWRIVERWGLPAWDDFAFFWVFNAIAIYIGTVEVPMTRLSLVEGRRSTDAKLSASFVVLLTAAFATSPPTAFAVAFVPSVLELRRREGEDRPVLRIVFNSAQEGIYVGVASALIVLLGSYGVPAFAAAAAVGVSALSLNTVLVAAWVSILNRVTWRDIARRMIWPLPHSIAFGLIAMMIATLYMRYGGIAALFFFMPLAALRFVRQAKLGLDAARDDAILRFVRAVEEKDPYTFRHSERVAEITVALHRELGSKARDLDKRWYAAVLHDVGKVAVPIEVLTKPGQLEPWEYEEIKKHPGLGAEVVADINLFDELSPEIRAHHERLDGRGYPDGLVGNEIPLAGRILAVADAFEALTSDRPYRRALTTKEALDELWRSAGKQHDPEALKALQRVLERGVSFVRPAPRRLQEVPAATTAAAAGN